MKRHSSKKVPEERSRDKNEDYRGELRKLQKQVAQLQKENARLRNRDEGLQDLFEEFGHLEQQQEIENQLTKINCPACKSGNVKLMSLRHEDSHFSCNECGKTGPVKNE